MRTVVATMAGIMMGLLALSDPQFTNLAPLVAVGAFGFFQFLA